MTATSPSAGTDASRSSVLGFGAMPSPSLGTIVTVPPSERTSRRGFTAVRPAHARRTRGRSRVPPPPIKKAATPRGGDHHRRFGRQHHPRLRDHEHGDDDAEDAAGAGALVELGAEHDEARHRERVHQDAGGHRRRRHAEARHHAAHRDRQVDEHGPFPPWGPLGDRLGVARRRRGWGNISKAGGSSIRFPPPPASTKATRCRREQPAAGSAWRIVINTRRARAAGPVGEAERLLLSQVGTRARVRLGDGRRVAMGAADRAGRRRVAPGATPHSVSLAESG